MSRMPARILACCSPTASAYTTLLHLCEHASYVLVQAAFELVVEPVVRSFSPDIVSDRAAMHVAGLQIEWLTSLSRHQSSPACNLVISNCRAGKPDWTMSLVLSGATCASASPAGDCGRWL
jgi:hypothetical protein